MISRKIKSMLVLFGFNGSVLAQAPTIVVPIAHNQEIVKVVVDRENKFFYTADDAKVIMWDFKTMTQLYSFTIASTSTGAGIANTVNNLKEFCISPDGKTIAFTTAKDSLKVYSTTSGRLVKTIPGVSSRITFSKDSKTIYDLVAARDKDNSAQADGRMVRAIDIATGNVREYWLLKELNDWGSYANYFHPLQESRILNFNEQGYQVLDLDDKKEVLNAVISAEARSKFADQKQPFNEHSFQVFPESGLMVFQQHQKSGLGWTTWDIYANKAFAFIPSYAEITIQESANSKHLLYKTRSNRYQKQELVIFSNGSKVEKKKLFEGTDEINVATLCKNNNTILYTDKTNTICKANLETITKDIIRKTLPDINESSFYRDGDMLNFNASTAVTYQPENLRYETFASNYTIDLNRAVLFTYDTIPSKPLKVVSTIKLAKDSFLLDYEQMGSGKNSTFIYDQKRKRLEPLILEDFGVSTDVKFRMFWGLPDFFLSNTPGIAYYSAGEYGKKETDPYTCNLYKYTLATKKSEKIFTAFEMLPDKWESLGGGRKRPSANQQLIMDKPGGILAAAEFDFKGSIRILDLKTGKVLASHPFQYDSLAMSRNVNKQNFLQEGNDYRPFIIKQVKRLENNIVKVLSSEYLYEFNLSTGTATKKKIIDSKMFDGKSAVNIFGDHQLKTVLATYDNANETIVKTLYGPNQYKLDHIASPVKNIEFTSNDSILYTINADKTMNAYNAKTGKYYGTLYLFENSTDWVFVDADGRFDGTDNGMKRLYYLKGREVIDLDKVYEKYYTPNLFTRLVNGERFDPVPQIEIKPKPTNKIFYAEKQRNLEVDEDKPMYPNTTGVAEITVQANAPEDKVDEIRLFHNGKAITLATRGMFVTEEDGTEQRKYTVNLLPGQNSFRAVSLNSQRTESNPDEIVVNYITASNNTPVVVKPVKNNSAVIAPINKNATLHLIVVGINDYQNKSMSLNYAMADATSFKEELEKDAKTIIANIKTHFVSNNSADKAGITNAFKQVQKDAKAQDVFVFYYAGHGVIGKDKEFYLVPTDVSDLKNVQTELEQKGIASKLLQQYAIDIQAQKQLFILDACQSAGAFEKLLSNDGNQQKSLAVVARSTGTHWIAASGAMQFANEFSSLGHGVFTYVLLQALKGEAANNKMITVNGLKNFLQVQVPLLMKKYNGAAQYPASYGMGNDFPVEVIK